jgi:hypothetical protein
VPLLEKGLSWTEIQDENIFVLLRLLKSFFRKNEIELARYWLDEEFSKLRERTKPPQLYNSRGEAIPIQATSEDLFYKNIEKGFLEDLESELE